MRIQRVVTALLCGAVLALVGCASGPPPAEIQQARLAIEDARAAKAETLAPAEYNAATAHWSIADKAWSDKKDAASASHFARLAEAEAREAQYRAEAKTAQDALKAQTERKAQGELAVRDAQIGALQVQAKTEAERRAAEAEARAAAERARAQSEAARAQSESERREAEARLAAERARSENEAAAARTQAERDRAAAELARTQAALEATRQAAEADRQKLEEQRRAEEAQAAEVTRLRAEQEQLRTTLAKLAEVREDPRGLIVTLPGSIYFDVNKSDVKPAMRQRLEEIGSLLRGAQPKILIEGHTDADGTADYNLQLSRLRSDSVRSVLIGAGVPPDRIETTGYGETRPLASNGTSSGKAQNRRVEIIIEGAAPVAVR